MNNDKIDKVLEKLDKIDERVDRIDVTLGKQEVHLEEHIRRTNILEGQIKENEVRAEKDLAPIKKHVTLVNTVVKILIFLGGLAGVALTLKQLLE